MSGICDTCHREPCRLRMDGIRSCDMHEGGETRWQRLFGTPERAARTFATLCDKDNCYGWCPECGIPEWAMDGYSASLEWLRGDAE